MFVAVSGLWIEATRKTLILQIVSLSETNRDPRTRLQLWLIVLWALIGVKMV